MWFIDAVRQMKGKPAMIPGCTRMDFPQFLVEWGCKVGAEIGVYKGEFTEQFCKAGLGMYAIDPWIAFPGQGRTQQVQERQDFLFSHACRTLAPYGMGPGSGVFRMTSMEAIEDFSDGSLDFVYIDGDHSFRHIAADICEWEKKGAAPPKSVAGARFGIRERYVLIQSFNDDAGGTIVRKGAGQ